jgi:hypothetical protein
MRAHPLRHELLARHLAHRLKNAFVADPAIPKLALDHGVPFGLHGCALTPLRQI